MFVLINLWGLRLLTWVTSEEAGFTRDKLWMVWILIENLLNAVGWLFFVLCLVCFWRCQKVTLAFFDLFFAVLDKKIEAHRPWEAERGSLLNISHSWFIFLLRKLFQNYLIFLLQFLISSLNSIFQKLLFPDVFDF